MTGFITIDKHLEPIPSGNMIVIAAQPRNNSLQLDLDYLLERITVLEALGYDTVVAWLKEDAEHIKQLMEKDDA